MKKYFGPATTWRPRWLLALLFLCGSACAQMTTYEIQGTFSDGGTFSGTFGYDPTANVYVNSGNTYFASQGTFDIATVGGSSNVENREFLPLTGAPDAAAVGDGASTPIEFQVNFAAERDGSTLLIIDWATPLTLVGARQSITGGSETYTPSLCASCTVTRQVTSGSIAPVTPALIAAFNAPPPVDPLVAQVATLTSQLAAANAASRAATAVAKARRSRAGSGVTPVSCANTATA